MLAYINRLDVYDVYEDGNSPSHSHHHPTNIAELRIIQIIQIIAIKDGRDPFNSPNPAGSIEARAGLELEGIDLLFLCLCVYRESELAAVDSSNFTAS